MKDAQTVKKIRARLLAFYDRHRRDLPWRRTSDPYAIWVSEIMLQQTQVDTVVPRYSAFLREFPSLKELARASEEQVCEAWAGLGYYRRARNLHKAATVVAREHQGEVPRYVDELMLLPGIGRYTAGAISSIAFAQEAPLVDGNVVRVLSRLFALVGRADEGALHKKAWELAALLVVGPRPGDFNQAVMELGATVCTPQNPSCGACPVASHCIALAQNKVAQYPAPKSQAQRKNLNIAFAWIESAQGLCLEQRPLDGLWAGLWELPSASGRGAKSTLQKKVGVPLRRTLARITHELSHRSVKAAVYVARIDNSFVPAARMRFFAQPLSAPLSALARKAIAAGSSAKG